MNPLVAKEIRILLPAYVMALLLAIVPAWLVQLDYYVGGSNITAIVLFPFGFGVAMLALSSFGREFGLKTFPLILAQPLERTGIWWTKVLLLAVAMATVFGAWCLAYTASFATGAFFITRNMPVWHDLLIVGATIVVVAFSGALWTTLLFRQVVAAFWFTILIPGAILMMVDLCGGTATVMFVAMGIYSVAGFWLAWWQFSHAQETAWTGGVINLPGWRTDNAAAEKSIRTRRPLAALFRKELQLHQLSLMGMGGLFVLHLGVIWLRKVGHATMGDTMRMALEVFGGLWFIVPVLTGSLSVSEERKLGTMQEILCLPVSSRIQFSIKLILTLILGGLLSALLFWTAEGIGGLIGAGSMFAGSTKVPFDPSLLIVQSLAFLGLAFIGFYASTLTRGIVQALAVAVATVIVIWMFFELASYLERFGIRLWAGFLVLFIALPTLIGTFTWLAWRNFRSVSENWFLWRRNLVGMAAAFVFILSTAAAIYNRVWELIVPLEPAHGPARLAGPKPTELYTSYGGEALNAILPDGRLWVDRIAYDPGRLHLAFRHEDHSKNVSDENPTGFRIGGKWISFSGNHIVGGSNWVDAVTTYRETVGIRADGTLWVSEKPRQRWDPYDNKLPSAEVPANLVRYGDGTDWKSVVVENNRSVMLLKRDGTLWNWGTNDSNYKHEWPGLRAFTPIRLGTDADWDGIFKGPRSIYSWKRDGSAWAVHYPDKLQSRQIEIAPYMAIDRVPAFDNIKWRSMAWYMGLQVGVRQDGTLWGWSPWRRTPNREIEDYQVKIRQIGTDTNWVGIAGYAQNMLVGLKADGSLWEWKYNFPYWYGNREVSQIFSMLAQSPQKLSIHTDWVAIGAGMEGGILSLAADGSLWYWWHRDPFNYSGNLAQPMLAPSRKPSKIENILAKEK